MTASTTYLHPWTGFKLWLVSFSAPNLSQCWLNVKWTTIEICIKWPKSNSGKRNWKCRLQKIDQVSWPACVKPCSAELKCVCFVGANWKIQSARPWSSYQQLTIFTPVSYTYRYFCHFIEQMTFLKYGHRDRAWIDGTSIETMRLS